LYASRVGTNFVFTRESLQGLEDAELVPQIHYLDADGMRRIAEVFIDETPPAITPQVSGTQGENGWYVSDVALSWSVSDDETEVTSENGCHPETIDADGTHDRTCAAISGGGTSSETVEIKRDATPPTIVGTFSGAPNAAGWFMSDVVVSWDCGDDTSGVASCTAPETLGEGADQSRTGVATDNAGNGNTDTVSGIHIDETPPVVTLTTPADGETFVLAQVALANWSASDAPSGLSAPALGTVDDEQPFDTSTTGTKNFVVTATDLAGNTTEVTHSYTVLSPEEATEALIEDIEEHDLVPRGATTSLVSQLKDAIGLLQEGNTDEAVVMLNDFINHVSAQRGKKLTEEVADALIAMALLILGSL
jgi:hypothetical protein